MTLQSSGAISINNINTELGSASGTPRSLGDASSRNLAGVPSGAISLSNFYGKSNVQEVIFDNSGGAWGNWQNQNLWNTLVSSGIAITSSIVKVILRNITITSSAISTAALETGSGWPAGTKLELVIESTSQIVGRGGTGGAGAPATFNGVASAGGAGGRALTITSAISGGSIKITNQGAIRGGGGGGGGGGRGSNTTGGKDKVTTYHAGGTGGTGYGSTGTAGAVAAATAGTKPTSLGGQGGTGGAAGTVGNAGAAGTGTYSAGGAAGGAAGPAIINSALATIVNTGTISGSLS